RSCHRFLHRAVRRRRRRRLDQCGSPRLGWNRRLGRRRRWWLERRRRWWLERWRRRLRRRWSVGTMVSIGHTFRHLFTTGWSLRRAFDAATLQAVEQASNDNERAHGGGSA